MTDLIELQNLVLKNVVDEINRNQGVPVSFNSVMLEKKEDNKFTGKIQLSEPSHVWYLDITVWIEGKKIYWQIDDHAAYSFDMI